MQKLVSATKRLPVVAVSRINSRYPRRPRCCTAGDQPRAAGDSSLAIQWPQTHQGNSLTKKATIQVRPLPCKPRCGWTQSFPKVLQPSAAMLQWGQLTRARVYLLIRGVLKAETDVHHVHEQRIVGRQQEEGP